LRGESLNNLTLTDEKFLITKDINSVARTD
jgi:hypothetical protein